MGVFIDVDVFVFEVSILELENTHAHLVVAMPWTEPVSVVCSGTTIDIGIDFKHSSVNGITSVSTSINVSCVITGDHRCKSAG